MAPRPHFSARRRVKMASNGTTNGLQILGDAVARNAACVLSIPTDALLRYFRTRFLGEGDDGIWIEASAECAGLIDALAGTEIRVAVSFRSNARRYNFVSTLRQLDRSFQINANVTGAAVLVARPAELKGVQRRSAYRVPVRPADELSVRMWKIPEHACLRDKPLASQEIKVEPRDLSTGGVGVRFVGKSDQPVRVAADQRVRVLLTFGEEEMLIEGRVRLDFDEAPSANSPAGVMFQKLGQDHQSRRNLATLTRIIGQLQQDEVRRARVGAAP
jgi:c-di-GMP-binding flagellar brake protein YcgR